MSAGNKTKPNTQTDTKPASPAKDNPGTEYPKFSPTPELEALADEYISHYPQKRSASLMILHLIQERYRHISPEAIEWAAKKLGLQPINLFELVTFYPMFHRKPVGKFHFRICRTLSCALAGSHEIKRFLCEKLGLDPDSPGVQTTPDGMFTVEFVECLANCDKAPSIMCNDKLYDKMTKEAVEKLVEKCKSEAKVK